MSFDWRWDPLMAETVGLFRSNNDPGLPNRYGIGRNRDDYASQTRSVLARRDWEDYQARFRPLEQMLLGAYGNKEMKAAAQTKAVGLFNDGMDRLQAGLPSRLESYGIRLTPEQQASTDRRQNLQRGLGTVEAFNRTGRRIEARDQMILTGGGPPRQRIGLESQS